MITENISYQNMYFKKNKEKLNPATSLILGEVYGTYLGNKGTIFVGRDQHPNSKILKLAFITGLLSTGIDVIDLSEISTPVLRFIVKKYSLDGGVIFNNIHNNEGYTDIKIYENDGVEVSGEKIKKIYGNLTNLNINLVQSSKFGKISRIRDIRDIYQKGIMQFIDKEVFSGNNLTIIVDCVNGPISNELCPIFRQLNINFIFLNSQKSNLFNQYSYINSFDKVSKIIKELNADLGVIFEGNGEKVIFLDEKGNFINEEGKISYSEYGLFFSDTIVTTLKLCELISKNKLKISEIIKSLN